MANVSELFGGLKSKLGIRGRNAQDDYDEYDEYDEYEDEYEDYDDYDDYDDGYTTRDYGSRGTVTTRERGSMPRLVSYSDVRESSRSLSYGGGTGSTTTRRSGSSGRTMMDSSLPRSMTPEGAAEVSAAASRRHAGGLDSLFSSTSPSDANPSDDNRLPIIGAAGVSRVSAALGGSRGLRVIRPTDYAQVADVAGMLRAGDAVVLVFKSTPESLEKRLLDFSFGVASALDASVDCIADKVFAITVGQPLSESEQTDLHTQGIL